MLFGLHFLKYGRVFNGGLPAFLTLAAPPFCKALINKSIVIFLKFL